MDVIPSAKRRRLNEITNQSPARTTLSKPFKSPLKRSFVAANSARGYVSIENDVATPASENDFAPTLPSVDGISSSKKPLTAPQRRNANAQVTLPTTLSCTSTSTTTTTTPTSLGPMALTTRIRSLRSDIDALTQATKLLSSLPPPNPKSPTRPVIPNHRLPQRPPSALPIPEPDRQLLTLAERWQATARAAAEDVYASTRDRVNRMGGVGAWRQREREGRERRAQWEREANAVPVTGAVMNDDDDGDSEDCDDDDNSAADGANGGDGPTALERREARRMQRDAADWSCAAEPEVEPGAVPKESAVNTTAEIVEGADDDEFSMAMMLKTLGVDVAILGYSETELNAA